MIKVQRFLRCRDCHKKLLEFLVPEDNESVPSTYFMKATCPYCGDESFPYGVSRHMSLAELPNLGILEVTLEEGITKFVIQKV